MSVFSIMKSLCLSVFIVLCAVIATATIGETVSAKPLLVPGKSRPFIDPVWGGAADPCIIYNDEAGEYFIYYTQRRANLAEPKGVTWMHGSAIGIASTKNGSAWNYRGICQGDDQLGDPIKGNRTWWAPQVIKDNGIYHMFVVYVNGIYPDFGTGKAFIKQFTSKEGLTWKYQLQIDLEDDVIDPCISRIGGKWWMWYKHENKIFAATSDDLKSWTKQGQALKEELYEAPYVFPWKGQYWLLVDTMKNGIDVFKSPTATNNWTRAGHIWGAHPAVLEDGERRVLVCHTRDITSKDAELNNRRSQIQLYALMINDTGELQQVW